MSARVASPGAPRCDGLRNSRPLRTVLEAHARTLAAGTARYTWRTPLDGPAHTTAHGFTDLATGAATMTTTTTPEPAARADGDGVLVLDGLVSVPGRGAPQGVTAHALLLPEAGTLSIVLLDGPPSRDERGFWTSPRADSSSLPMEVDALLGSAAATFHWLAAVTSAEPDDVPGNYRVDLDLSRLVDDAEPHRRETVRRTLDRLHPGLASGSAPGTVVGTVTIDRTSGLVTSFGVTGPRIDPVLLELTDHGVAAGFGLPPVRD